MTDKLREAAQAALELLDNDDRDCAFAANILRAALAEPEQEPMHPEIKKMYEDYFDKCFRELSAPQKREWVGLTEEEISAVDWKSNETLHDFARAIETKLREKNGG
jgi:hypothetical protein